MILIPDILAVVHDPAAGAQLWDRLTVSHMPEEAPKKALDGLSGPQQAEELRQLQALAAKPEPAAAPTTQPAAAPGVSDQVDRLANWILSQAKLA